MANSKQQDLIKAIEEKKRKGTLTQTVDFYNKLTGNDGGETKKLLSGPRQYTEEEQRKIKTLPDAVVKSYGKDKVRPMKKTTIKKPELKVTVGNQDYFITRDEYNAINNNDWYYSPEYETEDFKKLKSYPIYAFATNAEDGSVVSFGNVSWNYMQAREKGNDSKYVSNNQEEINSIDAYNKWLKNSKPTTFSDLTGEVNSKIKSAEISTGKSMGYDEGYYQLAPSIKEKSFYEKTDEQRIRAMDTEADREQFLQEIGARLAALDKEWNEESKKGDKSKLAYIEERRKALLKMKNEVTSYMDVYLANKKAYNEVDKLQLKADEINSRYSADAKKASSTTNREFVPKSTIQYSTGDNQAMVYSNTLTSEQRYDIINMLWYGQISKDKLKNLGEQNWMHLTADELIIYDSLYQTDPKKADKYLDELDEVLQVRKSKYLTQQAYEKGKENPLGAGIGSVFTNIVGAPVALIDNAAEFFTTGEIDTYDTTSTFLRKSQAARAGGTSQVTEDYGKVAGWAYGTGLSILENAIVRMTTKGIGNVAGLGTKAVARIVGSTMAMNAASNQMIDIADRGGNAAQMIVGGFASGLAEYFFEKFSVENLLSPNSGSFIKTLLKQSGVEASEELFTEVANIISDTAVMGQNSESKIRARELIKKGMTAEEASKQVFRENLDRVLQASASGGVSGGVMGGTRAAFGEAKYNNRVNAIASNVYESPNAMDSVLRLGNEIGNGEAKYISEIMREGISPDVKQVRTLVESVVNDSIGKDARLPNVMRTIAAIEGRKSDYYTSQEAFDTARAVLKMANGTATKADYALIEKSDGARSIILNTNGTTAWDKMKAEADKRSAEYGARSVERIPSPPEAALSPLNKERSEVRSEEKSATISDGEIYSNGKRVTIDKSKKVAGYVVLNEESYNFRKANKEGYDVIQRMAKDHKQKVQYVDGLTDSEGKALDGVITSEGIFINTQSKNPTRWVATHEFSHRMKQTGGKMWQRYQDYVISHLKETGKYEERYNLKKSAYAENEIDEEIAADYIGEMFEDVKELSDFIRRNRRDAFGIRNAYYKVLDKLGLLDEKKKAQAMWAKAYREAMKNSDARYEDGVHKSKSETRVDDSSNSKYNNTEQFRTMWTIEEGVLTRGEVRQFYSEIQNLANGSEKYEISSDGDYIFEIGNKLVYTDGDFDYPTISKVVTFNVESKTEFYDVKEFYDDISSTTESEELSQSITEDVYGEGIISRRNFEESKAYERQNRQRKGTNSKTTDRGTRKSVSGTRVEDSKYLELAKNPEQNEARLNEAVKAAAEEAGFPTRLYHGTTGFGWTKADVRKSDDGISVFATDSIELAGTYSGVEGHTPIKGSNRKTDSKKTYDNAVTSFVDSVNKITGTELIKSTDVPFEKYIDKIRSGKMSLEELSNKVTEYTSNIVDEVSESGHLNKETETAIWRASEKIESALIGMRENSGNYGLYANTDGFLEVEGNGASWSSIPFDKIPSKTTANTREIVKWAKENGYQGVLFKNIYDKGYHGGLQKTPANVYAFLNPSEQVKSADPVTYNAFGRPIPLSKRFNKKNEDIRYSVAGTRVEESESLKEENARLREELENIHLQLSQAEGKGLDLKAVKNAAIDLRKKYSSNVKVYEFHQELSKIYQLMASNKANSNEVSDRVNALAKKVIDNATETVFSDYHELVKDLRKAKIKVPEADKTNFAEGYENFRKSSFGKINLTNEGYPLDALWDDLVKEYPNLFNDGIRGSEERLERILEVIDEYKPVQEDVYKTEKEKQEAVVSLANDIMDTFFEVPEGGESKYVFYDKRAIQAEKEVEKAKEAVEKAEEKTEKLRDRYDREKVKKGIDRYFNYLFRMYSDPTDARHIPENLRKGVKNILERISFETKHTDKLAKKGEESALSIRLEGIAEVFRKIQENAWGVLGTEDSPTIEAALRQDLAELISEIPVDESGNYKRLEDMTTEELKAVYEMLMAVHHAVIKSNEAFSDSISGKIDENAEKVDREMENVRSKRKGSGEKIEGEGGKIQSAVNSLDNYINAALYKPWDFFNKIGGTMQKLYMATRDAFDDYLKNLQTFKKKLDEATEKINVKKLNKVETVKLLGGAEIKLTRGQMIGIVATSRRPAGRTHIFKGGIVTNRPWKDENGHKRTGVAPIKLNEHDVGVITEMLTKEEKDMMFALVDFMSEECSKWGNETSVKLLGYEKYGEGWYYPVKVWDGSLDKSAAKKGEKNLTNKSFTKKLAPNAGNAIEINDFLDVVMDHVNSMNMYSTVALPLLDMERVLNHRGEGTASKDARDAIRRTYGKSAEEFIYKWIRKVNGMTQKVEKDLLDKLIANTKKAHIAFKPSVFLKQGTSIVRVLQVMNPVYLRSALKSYVHPIKTIQEMQENVPIAFWKSLGFRDPAMGTGIKNALLGTESVTDKLGFGLYGLADDFTWGIIYNAVKTEVKSKNKGIDVNSEEFKQKVVERFNYIIDRTQVVDSPFHSAQITRSNNPLTKITTSYMAEPLTTLNLYRTDLQDATKEAIEKRTSRPIMAKAVRSTTTYLLSSFLLAIAGALPKMLKEDPEDKYDDNGKKVSGWKRLQTYVEEGFADESNPFNLVPYLNKVIDIWEGWEQKDWSFESIEDVVNSIKNFTTENGQKKGWYVKIRDFSSAIAVLFGQPYGNAVKEIEGIAKTVMHMAMGEYGDYLITKSKWDVKNPKNKSKFMKHYENAVVNGDVEAANDILTDYLEEVFPGKEFDSKYSKEVLEEMAGLYGKTDDDSKLLLGLPDDQFSYDGNEFKIPESEYDEYVEGYYGKLWEIAYEFVTSEGYDELSDEEKVKAFGEIKTYSAEAQRMDDVDGYELNGWKKEVYEGESEYIDSFVERQEKNAYEKATKDWKKQNFNFDESGYSEAEISSMNNFEETAAAFYTSQEMGIPYEEGKYRRVQVYQDYLSGDMSIEEFASSYAYATKVASTMGEGSTENMSTKELKAYLDGTDYSIAVKGALFEAIGNKGWKNPYTGGKVGDGIRFPVITTSPEDGKSSEVKVPETRKEAEGKKTPASTPQSNKKQTKKVTVKYDSSKYTPKQVTRIEQVESDANSYYNSPRLTNYSGSKLRHMNVYDTKLKPYMTLDNYAKIRAEAYGNKDKINSAELEKYIAELDFDKQVKAALFEAIGEENWKNPFEG